MFRFVLKRLLLSLPVLLGVSVVVFALVHLAPGGPVRVMLGPLSSEELVRQIRLEMGLNRPLYVQYGLWMLDALQGDFGVSWTVQQGTPVTDIIVERIPLTVELSILSMITAILIAIPAGIISAVRKDKPADHAARIAALSGISIPDFWLGIILIMIFAVQFSFPWATGGWTPPWVDPVANLQQLFLPVITLGTAYSALIARMMRSEMLDTLSQDYVKTARAMGIGAREIVLKDASKNALIPVVTVIGVGLGQLMNGAILTETVFNLPGIGKLLILAIDRRDYRIIQALILFIASVFVFANLAVDVLYAYLDPRIRHDGN
ncbi:MULTISPECIES: ABC transporter permease [Haloferax]|uniref:ABC transporter permease n=3 Tax=Haloferax volcanii TaxID=2246 RepID=A0A6C0V212_HALVO|nr:MULTISPECIES: ABC transporter permease [Haloferax]ELK55814.1 putative dipeptides/oligopeptides ABC transporter permease [Haloferax sp. BAB-2207]ELZ75269.1 putative dipeptides/oligopeptides ABC transporter permease [Haloferax lucentense DSM 14919]ELZ87980.1 putative dipeptides/oligopeptides ABC transporter permease [Haloferax alexandrinus JCM 10717]MBC9986860.1 ABC transporter permease [Haloferax sp. AS1]NLV03698.1 ABC transporter permease subunit [Haloferax alexandrinus]